MERHIFHKVDEHICTTDHQCQPEKGLNDDETGRRPAAVPGEI